MPGEHCSLPLVCALDVAFSAVLPIVTVAVSLLVHVLLRREIACLLADFIGVWIASGLLSLTERYTADDYIEDQRTATASTSGVVDQPDPSFGSSESTPLLGSKFKVSSNCQGQMSVCNL